MIFPIYIPKQRVTKLQQPVKKDIKVLGGRIAGEAPRPVTLHEIFPPVIPLAYPKRKLDYVYGNF